MKYNVGDFANKIDSEGGLYSALEYGLKVAEYDLPQNVVDKFMELELMFAEMDELAQEFWVLIDKAISNLPEEGDE